MQVGFGEVSKATEEILPVALERVGKAKVEVRPVRIQGIHHIVLLEP